MAAARRPRRSGSCARTSTPRFRRRSSAYGLRAARSLWQSMRRASLDFAAALRRLRHPLRSRAAGSVSLRASRGRRRQTPAARVRRPAAGRSRSQLVDGRRAVARDVDRGRRRNQDARLRVRSISCVPRPRGGGVRPRTHSFSSAAPSGGFARIAKRVEVTTAKGVVDGAGSRRRDERAAARSARAAAASSSSAQLRRGHRAAARCGPARARARAPRRLRDSARHRRTSCAGSRTIACCSPAPIRRPSPTRARDKTLVQRPVS